MQAGADSLKIEGRLKRPKYVALTTSVYRAALDDPSFDMDRARGELAQMFNRGGFTRGYGFGVEDAELMFRERPNHLGVNIGQCRRNGEVLLSEDVDNKDALVLRRRGRDDIPVHMAATSAGRASLAEARKGDQLFRLVSQAQMRDLQARFTAERKKFPVDIHLVMQPGMPARISMSDGVRSIACEGEIVQTAQSRPADPERIRSQIEKLGDTPFVLRDCDLQLDPMAYLPVSALNALRRQAVELLIAARMGVSHPCNAMEPAPEFPRGKNRPTELIAQSGDPEVLHRAMTAGADRICYAPEDLRADALNAALENLPERFDLALPPVTDEEALRGLNAWALENSGRIRRVYLANVGQLGLDWPGERVADASLNLANTFSLRQMADWGISLYTPSLELNRSQIDALGGRRQLIVYGAIPLMQLRHCPLRATQGLSGPHRSCRRCDGAPMEQTIGAKSLTDRTGAAFPLRRIAADGGCVIQLLNSAKLMLLRKAASLPACEGWRLLLDGTDDVETVVRLHRLAMHGSDVRSDPAWEAFSRQNTTTGHYFRGAE